jgi:uncharacterized membrane protein YjfL (UPF0719 family)
MFSTRVVVSIFELFFSATVSVLVVYVTYRIFILANTDFDGEEQIMKGNVAVAILTVAMMISASSIIQKGVESIESLFLIYMSTPVRDSFPWWKMGLLAFAHLFMSFFLAVITISFSLRLFGRLGRRMHLGQELEKGNVAVGILLAGAIFIVSNLVAEGVSSLSRSLMPQPSIGRIEIMK